MREELTKRHILNSLSAKDLTYRTISNTVAHFLFFPSNTHQPNHEETKENYKCKDNHILCEPNTTFQLSQYNLSLSLITKTPKDIKFTLFFYFLFFSPILSAPKQVKNKNPIQKCTDRCIHSTTLSSQSPMSHIAKQYKTPSPKSPFLLSFLSLVFSAPKQGLKVKSQNRSSSS